MITQPLFVGSGLFHVAHDVTQVLVGTARAAPTATHGANTRGRRPLRRQVRQRSTKPPPFALFIPVVVSFFFLAMVRSSAPRYPTPRISATKDAKFFHCNVGEIAGV